MPACGSGINRLVEVLRYAAFSTTPEGGNPAGVVLDAAAATEAQMQRVAAEVGYSETAFLVQEGPGAVRVRYFSPLAEVPFCGHATIASAIAHAHRYGPGTLRFDTAAGAITVTTAVDGDGLLRATLVSVPPGPSHSRTPTRRNCLPRLAGALTTWMSRCPREWPSPEPGIRCWQRRRAGGSPTWTTTSRAWPP